MGERRQALLIMNRRQERAMKVNTHQRGSSPVAVAMAARRVGVRAGGQGGRGAEWVQGQGGEEGRSMRRERERTTRMRMMKTMMQVSWGVILGYVWMFQAGGVATS
jgi:hypothetical protein